MTTNAVEAALATFRDLVNDHPRMKTLLKSWDRTAVVEVEDTGDVFTVEFRGCQIVDLQPGNVATTDEPIILKASERILVDIFTGVLNPASEFLDGRLQVFASDRDQVKLDAISLVLWS
jgi:vacuolar-type H+-ATPase subunit B/Vma2